MKSILVLFAFGVCALAQSIVLQTVIHDFHPILFTGDPHGHPDFEAYLGDDRGVVNPTLDQDGKPYFIPGAVLSKFTGESWFDMWYRDTPQYNIRILSNITLDDIGSGIYSYNNQAYFPIDNEGWGNYDDYGHNFHFTTEIQTTFTYEGGETFTFIGDDDVFVFISGNLVIDLGGVHGPESLSVSLDSLGLTVGTTYDLVVFQAERHTTGSTFRMDTSLALVSTNPPSGPSGSTVYFCGVKFDGYCAGIPADQCPGAPTFSSFGNAKRQATLVPGATSFDNFNVVSFGDFNADTGDVQGSLAVQNNLIVGDGYSVGAYINNAGPAATDLVIPYTLVVGGDATFGSGAIEPDGLTTDAGFNSVAEGVFIGGTFNAPSYLQAQVTGSCSSTGCLNSDFSNAQDYYTTLSAGLSTVPANTAVTIDDASALNIDCTDPAASTYYVTLTASQFSSILSYNTPSGCNANAAYVFNIVPNADGTDSVTVSGAGQTFADPSNVVYNFPADGSKKRQSPLRSITTPNGGLNGGFLGPQCNLNAGTGVNTGITIAGNVQNSKQFNKPTCPPQAPPQSPPNGSPLCPWFETDCQGLNFPLGQVDYSFRDFNVISFGDFNANTGDVEGRIAVRNDFTVGAGYSVGAGIQTGNGVDNYVPYSLVAGGSCVFPSGAVYPEGNGIPYPGQEEDIFCGSGFTGEADLAARVSTCNVAGCLNSDFDNALACYTAYSTSLGNQPDNVQVAVQYSALELTCNDNTADAYSVTITPDQFAAATYYVVDNCNLQATWVINVAGTDDVTLSGDSFPGIAGGVVYNVLGSGRTVSVTSTAVNGNILAPGNTLDQTGGVILGKVVVGDVEFSLQINKPDCPSPPPVTVNAVSDSNSAGSSKFVVSHGGSSFVIGDNVTVGDEHHKIVNIQDGVWTFDSNLKGNTPAGTRVYTVIQDPALARVNGNATLPNAASSVQIQAVFVLVLLFIALLA